MADTKNLSGSSEKLSDNLNGHVPYRVSQRRQMEPAR